ncbi:MAG TPA: Hsp20/alpha crystallin family protein [Blastocatellia bacterium]|jgi:HSP20 family protein
MATGTGLAPVRGFRNLLATDPFRLLQQKMGRFFDEPFAPLAFQAEEPFALTTWTPSCDIYEANGEIIVKAELPGLKKEDVKVMIENNVLTIRGERKFEEEVKREDYYRIERSYGEFLRVFTLPVGIDPKKINAEFKDGMLKIVIPKVEEAKPKAIDIKVG